MLVGRLSQYFKVFLVITVAIIFIIATTRQHISEIVDNKEPLYKDQRAEFIKQVKEQVLTENKDNKETNINNNNEQDKYSQTENNEEFEEDTPTPIDEKMPAAYLSFKEPAETNKSYCKFNYGLPYDLLYFGKSSSTSPEEGDKSPYRILYNVTEAYDTQNVAPVTYASHITANFAYYIPELLRYWDGLVTITAFVPDLDTALFLEQINQYCYCEPEMHRVSIHLVTHKTVPFSKKDIYFERPYNCVPQDSSKISIYTFFEDTLMYPINVLRNVARTTALTKYVLLSDIELMPSKGLASAFFKMLKKYKSNSTKEVFVLPIFEVENTESHPQNKETLLKLLDDKKAVYFHGFICGHCQKFPGIETWLSNGFSDEVKPLLTVKRHKPYHRWEPIFIGTNMEPLYSEKLSWEGFQDKMTQSLEMCLLDYNYTILDNAFLCHWPGIKKQKVLTEEWRKNFILENKAVYKEVLQRFQEKYVDIPECMANTSAFEKVEKKKNLVSL